MTTQTPSGDAELREAILRFDLSRAQTAIGFTTGKITREQADYQLETDLHNLTQFITRREKAQREALASAIWEDEQKALKELSKLEIGTPGHTSLNGRILGLQRARDIVHSAALHQLKSLERS